MGVVGGVGGEGVVAVVMTHAMGAIAVFTAIATAIAIGMVTTRITPSSSATATPTATATAVAVSVTVLVAVAVAVETTLPTGCRPTVTHSQATAMAVMAVRGMIAMIAMVAVVAMTAMTAMTGVNGVNVVIAVVARRTSMWLVFHPSTAQLPHQRSHRMHPFNIHRQQLHHADWFRLPFWRNVDRRDDHLGRRTAVDERLGDRGGEERLPPGVFGQPGGLDIVMGTNTNTKTTTSTSTICNIQDQIVITHDGQFDIAMLTIRCGGFNDTIFVQILWEVFSTVERSFATSWTTFYMSKKTSSNDFHHTHHRKRDQQRQCDVHKHHK